MKTVFMWRVVLLLGLAVISGCGAGQTPTGLDAASLESQQKPQPRPTVRAKAVATGDPELDPLVSLLQNWYSETITSGKPLVIEEKTGLGLLLIGESFEEFEKSLVTKASDQVPAELIKDFCAKNVNSRPVWEELARQVPLHLITREEQGVIFEAGPDDGWKAFDQKYAGSPGIITVSRVGLNRSKDMAMFYLGFQRAPLNGHGQLHVVKKVDGEWVELPVSIGPSWES